MERDAVAWGLRLTAFVFQLLFVSALRGGHAIEGRAITVQSLRYTPLCQPIVIVLARDLRRATMKGGYPALDAHCHRCLPAIISPMSCCASRSRAKWSARNCCLRCSSN